MTHNNYLPYKLYTLRKKLGMTQTELATLISERSSRPLPLSTATVSSWETGRKRPSSDILKILCSIYDVQIEELLVNPSEKTDSKDHVFSISSDELKKFHGQPVYVTFENHEYRDQWAIVNIKKNKLIMTDQIINIDDSIKKTYFTKPETCLDENIPDNYYPLSLRSLLATSEPIWVRMKTPDNSVHAMYDGYYTHNELKTCLIKNNGLTLPYHGLGISFLAYKVSF